MPSRQSATDVTKLVALLAKMAFWPLSVSQLTQASTQNRVSYQAEEVGVAVLQTGPVWYKARTHSFTALL